MNNDEDRQELAVRRDALGKYLGITLVEAQPGYAVTTMTVKPELLNGVGITHGGTLFTLADIAMAAASNSHGPMAVALDVHISFLKATKEGEVLTATAREENLTSRTGLYRVEVRDSKDELVSVVTGRVARKK